MTNSHTTLATNRGAWGSSRWCRACRGKTWETCNPEADLERGTLKQGIGGTVSNHLCTWSYASLSFGLNWTHEHNQTCHSYHWHKEIKIERKAKREHRQTCFLHSPTYLLYAPRWGWPWCCICECSGSTRSVSDAPHPLLHFYARLQSKNPTAGTRQRELSCPDPVKRGHTEQTFMFRRAENGGVLPQLPQVTHFSWSHTHTLYQLCESLFL